MYLDVWVWYRSGQHYISQTSKPIVIASIRTNRPKRSHGWIWKEVMFPRISKVRYLQNYELELTFTDGMEATLDFRKRVVGRTGVFRPLEDPHFFAKAAVDPEAGTVVWPNGADLCPDVLYADATGKSVTSYPTVAART
jgi:hypothetical protein